MREVNARRYFLVALRREGLDGKNLVMFYTTCIRPVLEYAAPAWHPGLSTRLSNQPESTQRLCLRSVFSVLNHSEALLSSGLTQLCSIGETISVLALLSPPSGPLDNSSRRRGPLATTTPGDLDSRTYVH